MSSIPCGVNAALQTQIRDFSEVLKTQAHTLGNHGLSERDFYDGVFRGAIERVRGQFSATMAEKRAFARQILNHLQDRNAIVEWDDAGEANRHDYMVLLPSGRRVAIELKGCLDGNNTNIFERPASADEFVIWSICSNSGADPRHNVWSGIHTRLSAEIIEKPVVVDGLIVWDWLCGSFARPCPKRLSGAPTTVVGQHTLPPPCIYLFPRTVPNERTNPEPPVHTLDEVGILAAFHNTFGGRESELNFVGIHVRQTHGSRERRTVIRRDGVDVVSSDWTAIRRG